MICQIFEEIINEHQPFLTVEPTSILDYNECNNIFQSKLKDNYPLIKSNMCSNTTNEEKGINIVLKKNLIKELNIPKYIKLIWESETTKTTLSYESELEVVELWKKYGEQIYEHWKNRKLERHGATIRPHLRFEKTERRMTMIHTSASEEEKSDRLERPEKWTRSTLKSCTYYWNS